MNHKKHKLQDNIYTFQHKAFSNRINNITLIGPKKQLLSSILNTRLFLGVSLESRCFFFLQYVHTLLNQCWCLFRGFPHSAHFNYSLRSHRLYDQQVWIWGLSSAD